jgi:alanine racemase
MTSTPERAAWVEVDGSAIRHNLGLIRHLAGKARVYVVCKGDAYGFDAVLVARLAAECRMDALACGDPEDVRRIRAVGIDLPILLYGVTAAESLPALKPYGVIATAHDFASLSTCLRHRVPFSVKLDAGFGRLGFRPEQLDELCRVARANPTSSAHGVYAHIADTDEPESVAQQVRLFTQMTDALEDAGWRGLERMVASSRVLIARPDLSLDAVNPGRLVYGILEPPWNPQIDARPALSAVRARVIAVKQLRRGERVGYSRERLVRDTTLAIVPYGFGDGYPRFPPGGSALIRERHVPIVGPRHTEHTILDVTDVSGVELGDQVTFLGMQGDERIEVGELVEQTGVPMIELVPRLARGPNVRVIGGYSDGNYRCVLKLADTGSRQSEADEPPAATR